MLTQSRTHAVSKPGQIVGHREIADLAETAQAEKGG